MSARNSTSKIRFVYFIQTGESGPIKIGRTQNPKQRLQCLQTHSAFPLRLLTIALDQDETNESVLHERFSHLRQDGEWFSPGPDLLSFIADNIAPPLANKFLGPDYRKRKRHAKRRTNSSIQNSASSPHVVQAQAILVLRAAGWPEESILTAFGISPTTAWRRLQKLSESADFEPLHDSPDSTTD